MEVVGLKLRQQAQVVSDKIIVYPKTRWAVAVVLLLAYATRVLYTGGYYVVSYALAIFILNLFIRFLTPLMADLEDEDSDRPVLPMRETDEYRPFVRKLSEFKFWKNLTIAASVAFVCTYIKSMDIPVFWPVLVMYFIVLFVATMRNQIAHMIKHKYIPFNFGKPTYNPKFNK